LSVVLITDVEHITCEHLKWWGKLIFFFVSN